jgi:hypothetical protein
MERAAGQLPAGPFLLAGQRPAPVIRLDEPRAAGIRIPADGGVSGLTLVTGGPYRVQATTAAPPADVP